MRGCDTQVDNSLLERVKTECSGQLCARRNGMPPKTRKFIAASGFGPSHNLGVYNCNVDTVQRAFVERYFLCKEGEGFRPALPVNKNGFTNRRFANFQRMVVEDMPTLPRLTRQQVVDRYTGSKRKVYENALLSLSRKPICKSDARLTSFVKFEKQDVHKAPRVINPRSSRFNLELGRYLKHAEHHYFDSINKAFGGCTRATVIKGFNSDVSAEIIRSKWDLFKNPVAVGLDASKFDMHVSVQALKYEHAFYTQLFPGSQRLVQLLKWQLFNEGVAYTADGTVEFKMHGTRSSGDLNTSLGNCLLMCAMIHAYSDERGVKVELCNNGDDCVIIMEQRDLDRFQVDIDGWFRRRGFAMTIENPVYEFEQIDFCQTRPVQLQSGWRMIRNHASVLTKDPMCLLSVPNGKVYRKWLDAVGTCGMIASSGVPVQRDFYAVYKRSGVDAGERLTAEIFRNRSMLGNIKNLRECAVDARARVSYYYAFGILPDVQKQMESYYNSMDIMDYQPTTPMCREDLKLEPGLILNQSN